MPKIKRSSRVFFGEFPKATAGSLRGGDFIEIEVLKTFKASHPHYGDIEYKKKDLNEIIKNFEDDTLKQEVPFQAEHYGQSEAMGWVKGFSLKGSSLIAKLEITQLGADKLNDKQFKYFSAELERFDAENNVYIENIITGGAFTNHPFVKGMSKVVFSTQADGKNVENIILFSKSFTEMNKELQELLEKAKEGILTFSEKTNLMKCFNDLPEAEQTDEVKKEVDEAVDAEPTPADPKPADPKTEEGEEGDKPKDPADPKDPVDPKDPKKPEEGDDKQLSENMAKDLNDTKKELSEMKTKLMKKEYSEKLGVMKNFSDTSDKMLNFAMSLSEEKATIFFSILEDNNVLLEKFKETNVNGKGFNETVGKDGTITKADLHKEIKKYSEEKSVQYDEAYTEVMKKYSETKITNE